MHNDEHRAKLINAAHRSLEAKRHVLGSIVHLLGTVGYSDAVDCLMRSRGRCIVTGIGKSGHIGRKIAATMLSTGQPAAFLHPAEAAHGDMAMIEPGDVVMLLSNSGETDELLAIIKRAVEAACTMIMITKRRDGLAARAVADYQGYLLVYQLPEEGDTLSLAPMASSFAQLAIGDAIAASLMELRGFTAEDFSSNHHGGYLGRVASEAA